MTELVGNWLHFTTQQPKRKRAEAVCFFCHSKKIKCDLQVSLPHFIPFRKRMCRVLISCQSRKSQGHARCSNCDNQDQDCHLRPSKRGKQRRRTSTQAECGTESGTVIQGRKLCAFHALARTTLTMYRGRCGRHQIRAAQRRRYRLWT